MHHVRSAALSIATILAIAACAGATTTAAPGTTSVPPAATSAASGDAVSIVDRSFQPGAITVPVGTTVTWTNNDSTGHTVTADDGSFDSKTIATGATFTQTFAAAGTFAYHCAIHPSMKATVVVQ